MSYKPKKPPLSQRFANPAEQAFAYAKRRSTDPVVSLVLRHLHRLSATSRNPMNWKDIGMFLQRQGYWLSQGGFEGRLFEEAGPDTYMFGFVGPRDGDEFSMSSHDNQPGGYFLFRQPIDLSRCIRWMLWAGIGRRPIRKHLEAMGKMWGWIIDAEVV